MFEQQLAFVEQICLYNDGCLNCVVYDVSTGAPQRIDFMESMRAEKYIIETSLVFGRQRSFVFLHEKSLIQNTPTRNPQPENPNPKTLTRKP